MAKSKIAEQSKAVKHIRNNQNVVPLTFEIPYKDAKSNKVQQFDVSHLLHLGGSKENEKINSRAVFVRTFCKKANQYVSNGNSARTVKVSYENLRSYLAFCDAINAVSYTHLTLPTSG
mgnify:FL=1